jgi:hypothetical protein
VPKILFYYNFVNEITNEEKDVLLATEPNSFVIDTIILLDLKVSVVVFHAKIDINAKIKMDPKTGTDTKTGTDMKISMDELIF